MPQPIYRSTDAGAPVLSMVAGSLVNVLDAILVGGYGSKAPLGWSIKFSGTNKRVYKLGAGSGFEMRVDNSATVYDVSVRGAESFSDIDTIGAGGFPTVAQLAGGIFWTYNANSAGNRLWVVIGDAKRFYMLTQVSIPGPEYNGYFFGDIVSFKAGDLYPCMIMGKTATSTSSLGDPVGTIVQTGPIAAASTGHYLARSYTGLGSAIGVNKYGDCRTGTATAMGTGVLPYPDAITGGLHLSRLWIGEPTPVNQPRGYIPGIWIPCHDRNAMTSAGVANGDTFNGTDGLVSRTFEYRHAHWNSAVGAVVLETSNWPESA